MAYEESESYLCLGASVPRPVLVRGLEVVPQPCSQGNVPIVVTCLCRLFQVLGTYMFHSFLKARLSRRMDAFAQADLNMQAEEDRYSGCCFSDAPILGAPHAPGSIVLFGGKSSLFRNL